MAEITARVVGSLFSTYGVRGEWSELPVSGVANQVYATHDVVLRVATDHPEAVSDARTESVAAPVAHHAGIMTPRMIAFDDSRTIVDRPFSLWERVHALTAGHVELTASARRKLWFGVGAELIRLHERVRECADPNGWLDVPGRDDDLRGRVERLVRRGLVSTSFARDAITLIEELSDGVSIDVNPRFLHNDIRDLNVMCFSDGKLAALIDWGDAGWGDPTLELVEVPLCEMTHVISGYERDLPGALGDGLEVRCAWDKLIHVLEAIEEERTPVLTLDMLRQLARANLRAPSS